MIQFINSTPSIFYNIFSNIKSFTTGVIGGLLALYLPTFVPIIALTAVITVNCVYECKAYNNCGNTGFLRLKCLFSKILVKLRDSIIGILGAYTIDHFIITSIHLHSVEFISGAIALVEFFTLLQSMSVIHPKWKVWSILEKLMKLKIEKAINTDLKELTDDTSNKESS